MRVSGFGFGARGILKRSGTQGVIDVLTQGRDAVAQQYCLSR
jgi:hypothetical protein